MILALRTDQPDAELHLLSPDGKKLAQHTWLAHRELSDTLVQMIKEFLNNNNTAIDQLTGLIIFTGAGSFTGLRIGTTVANALAYAHAIPIVAGAGDGWIADGLAKLPDVTAGTYVIPTYDREPNITQPKQATPNPTLLKIDHNPRQDGL